MEFNSFLSEMVITGSYSASERDLVDPSLQGFPSADEWQMRELLEKTGHNSTASPSPWNMHGSCMSSVPFDSFSVTNHQYVPSESSVSLPYSTAGSTYNGVHDWDSYGDPSTPGDAAAFSPGNDNDSMYQGEGYVPQLPFTCLEGPSNFQQNPACSVYDHEAYSISSEHGSSSSLPYHHQSYPTFTQGSGVIAAMTDSDMGSPSPHVLPATSYPVHEALSPAEESEIAFNRKPSPVASRMTKPAAERATKGTSKSAKGQSKISKPSGKALHNRSGSKPKSSICVQCHTSYKDSTALEKHVRTSHTRPFICVFHYAGCESTFATKNEWKRHVLSQHLYLEYFHCDHEECATAKPTSARRRPKNLPQYGGIFNRKDLFTQHVRRMHQTEDNNNKKKSTLRTEEQVKKLQDRAVYKRVTLPQHMSCPAPNCDEQFKGDKAWDERMEHVARHLEKAAAGEEEPVAFGGDHDLSLSTWAESPEVDVVRRSYEGWKLNNPIKGSDLRRNGRDGSTFDEDAEGEEC